MAERFVLGVIPGATPGRWVDTWRERMPRVPLELVELTAAEQVLAITEGRVDAALVRQPVAKGLLHVIPLYDERAVVVAAVDSSLLAVDELELADLEGEVLIVAADDLMDVSVPTTSAPSFARPSTTGEAIELVAAGIGVTIVPMSLARLHHRRDVDYRPLRDATAPGVALAWLADRTTAQIETFVGIVRGRSARSSRA